MEPQAFELTARERELVEELSWMLAHAIEQACPRLTVSAIDLEIATTGPHLKLADAATESAA